MAIIVTIALADGVESSSATIADADGVNVFVTVQNQSASPVTVTSAGVFAIPNTAPMLIGQMVFPQGGISIPGSSTVTLPSVSTCALSPFMQGQTAMASANTVQLVAAVQVSDGSTGASSPLQFNVNPALNPPPQFALGTSPTYVQGSSTNLQYTNVYGPGQLRYDQPLLDGALLLFPALGFGL